MTAGLVYMVTQLAKMLFLATFFPSGDDEFDESGGGEAAAAVAAAAASADFDFLTEFLKLTVDLADLIGLHMIMQRFVTGKGTVKILVAGVGWAFAEFLLTRVIFLWVSMFLTIFYQFYSKLAKRVLKVFRDPHWNIALWEMANANGQMIKMYWFYGLNLS